MKRFSFLNFILNPHKTCVAIVSYTSYIVDRIKMTKHKKKDLHKLINNIELCYATAQFFLGF